ncbi:UppP [Acrasis kona]|uniref:UppP n=1 Tax=Acrasis kona TaxID=1008807 RepID=A0AAW2YN80_9EUKA
MPSGHTRTTNNYGTEHMCCPMWLLWFSPFYYCTQPEKILCLGSTYLLQTSQQIIHDPTNELTIRAITDILKILLWDKAQHLAGFGLCFILFVAGRVHFYINPSPLRFDASAFTKYSLRAGMWFVVYACVSEILQYYVPLRNFSWLDMVSNVLGVILGAIIIVCCTVTISHYIKNN